MQLSKAVAKMVSIRTLLLLSRKHLLLPPMACAVLGGITFYLAKRGGCKLVVWADNSEVLQPVEVSGATGALIMDLVFCSEVSTATGCASRVRLYVR